MRKMLQRSERGMAFLLAFLMAVSSPASVLAANPIITEVKDEGNDLDYTFTENTSGDGTSADIQLEVIEKNGNMLTEVTMPDGTVIFPEARDGQDGFKQSVDGAKKNVVHYEATENGTVKFKLKYNVSIMSPVQEEPIQETQEQPESQPEFQSEPQEELQPEVQPEPTEKTEAESQMETMPESETQESEVQDPEEENVVSKVVDSIFPVMEVQAAEPNSATEERVMEVSYEVTDIVPLKETEETKAEEPEEEPEKDPVKDGSLDLLDDVATDATGSISISDNNTAITQPSDFVIGDPNQEYINLTVRYSPSNINTGRKVKITIPEGFVLVKVPSASDLVSASEIEQTGNVVDITFHDNINITATFDIQIQQNKKLLYENASNTAKKYEFLLEGFVSDDNVEVLKETFSFSTNELKSPEYTLEFDSTTIQYKPKTGAWAGNYTLSIKKTAQGKLDKVFLRVPRYMTPSKGNALEIRNMNSSWLDSADSNYYLLALPDSLNYAYTDTTYTYKFAYSSSDSKYDAGQVYQTPDFSIQTEQSGTQVWNTDKRLAFDASQVERSFQVSNLGTDGLKLTSFLGDENKSIPYQWIAKPDDDYMPVRNGRWTFTVPTEMIVTSVSADNGFVFKTNLGRSVTAEEIVALNPMNEWIASAVYEGTLPRGKAGPMFIYAVREQYPNGTLVTPGTYYGSMKVEALSETIEAYERDLSLQIVARDKDILKLSTSSNLISTSESYERLIGAPTNSYTPYFNVYLTTLKSNPAVQIYKNIELNFEGKELLSLVNRLGASPSVWQGGFLKYRTVKGQEYTINTEDNSGGVIELPTEDGDYIVGITITWNQFDVLAKGGTYASFYLFSSTNIPEKLPIDDYRELSDETLSATVTFTAENMRTDQSITSNVKFNAPVDGEFVQVDDLSGTSVSPLKSGFGEIGKVTIKSNSAGIGSSIRYENMVLDFSKTDPGILSLIDSVQPEGYNFQYAVYTTNFHTEERTLGTVNNAFSFRLQDGEYITGLKLIAPQFNTAYSSWIKLINTRATAGSFPNGTDISQEPQSYPITVVFSADNSKLSYEKTNQSVTIDGLAEASITGLEERSGNITYNTARTYQGNTVTADTEIYFKFVNASAASAHIRKPVLYYHIAPFYSYQPGTASVKGYEGEISETLLTTASGSRVLKLELEDYEQAIADSSSADLNTAPHYSFNTMLTLRVNSSAPPAKDYKPIKEIWLDLENSCQRLDKKSAALILENTVTDTESILGVDSNKKLYKCETTSSHEVLPVNEMGISSLGIENASFGETVKGHDNDKYGQQLSIISNYDEPTKDWIIYVPIPKEGKSVHYKILENGVASIGESPEAGIGMNLTGPVEIGNVPAGTRVSYTTDENPAYSLDGSSAGNYSESVSDWSKVTMVKIEVPELEAKEKIYPVLNYASDTKIKPKDLSCYGGVYFNAKVGDAADYFYGSEGSYVKNNTYTIIDYKVTGHVWEEMAVPSDHILTDVDQAKAGVTVSTTGKDGKTLKAVTDADGDYTLVIPSHGDYDISIQMPDNEHTKPKEKFTLVDAGQGTENNSSKFDPVTKKVSVTLDKDDIDKQNAGLWAERIAFVEPEDIYMAKGTTENVPVYYFPSYVKVTFGQADDTSIATVSDDGVITAIETGVTQAEASIPDGRGGTVTDTYNIHVIPQKPTAVPEIVHIFEGGSFDPKSGVTITDGDGNNIPVDDPKITIDNPVDTSIPGKYIVTYTITDEYDRVVKAYRSIYVHEKIQIVKPDDWLTKTGTQITSLDGVSASYGQIQEDGSIKRVDVSVEAVPADTFTLNNPGKQKVELTASVVYEGASDTANASYTVTFNDRPVITSPDEIYVKPGTSGTTLTHAINGTAAMETADGSVDLTDELIYEKDSSFDTSVPNSSGKVTLEVTDPDTGEVITKEVAVHITGEAVIAAENLDVVVGQAYDPSVKVTITDGRGDPVTFTPDMVKKGNVPVDDDGKLTTIGEYEVTYHYTDAYGNEAETTRTVKVNGALTLVTPDKHLRQEAGGTYTPDTASAYYRNSKNEKIEVSGGFYDVNVDLTDIKVTTVKYTATHPLSKEETEQGFDVYVHGNPVITAEGDSIYTHTSTGTDVLVDVIKAGTGNGHKTPAAAYVEYAKKDGTTQKIDLTAFIQYEVSDTYTEKTAGTYPVKLTVSDALYVLAAAPGLAPAETASSVYVEVADKIYTVKFSLKDGERGGTLSGDTADQSVKYNQHAAVGADVSVSVGSAFLGWSYSYTPAGTTTPVSGTVMDYTTVPILNDVTFIANFAKVPFVSGSSTNGFVSVQKGGAPADAGTDTITKIEYDLSDTLPAEAGFKFAGIPHYHIDEIKVSDLYNHEFILNLSSTEKQGFTVGEDGHTSDIQVSVDKANGTVQVAGIDESLRFSFAFAEDTKYTVSFKEEKDSTDNWGQNTELYTGDVMGNAPAEEPVKLGYAFDGWSSDGSNFPDKIYDPNALITDKDEVYYAVWIPKEYTIHYNTDGGTTVPDKTGVHYADKGLIPAYDPTKTGYTFAGWEKDTVKITAETAYSELVADDTVMEVTLTAKWKIKHYTASWVLKDGETLGNIEGGNQKEEGIAYNGNAAKDVTAAPASNDSEFIGWEYSYIPDGSTMPVTGFTDDYKTIPVLGDITFTARFAAKPFISIGATNGKVTAAKGTTPEEISESSGTTALVQFTAADDIENKKGEAALKYAADMHHHLTTISFKDTSGHEYTVWTKDGSGTTAGPDYEVGDKIPATKVTAELDEQNGTILVSNIDTSLAFTVVFEEDPKYKVEFFRDKDDPASLVQTNDGLYTGNPVGEKPDADPTKPGYNFLGWSMDGTNNPDKMYNKDTLIDNADVAYYGVWELIDYKLIISKTVDGEHGNKKQDFHFTMTLKDKDGTPLSGTYAYTGEAIAGVSKPGDGTVTLDAEGKAAITLRHGQNIILNGLHIGEQYTIEETEANQNGYVTSATGESNPNITGDCEAVFTNTRTTTPPTGIGPMNHFPTLILGVVFLFLTCAGIVWARRRRRA